MARRRDVERCAVERANLIIGAIVMAAVAQRKSHRSQRTHGATSARRRDWDENPTTASTESSAEGDRTRQVLRGRPRPEDAKL